MRSSLARPPAYRLALLLMLTLGVGASACTTVPVVIQPALACSDFIPPSYRQPVQSAPIPQGPLTVGALEDFGDGQTARLDQANGKTKDVEAICDAVDAANKKAAKALAPRPWWHFW